MVKEHRGKVITPAWHTGAVGVSTKVIVPKVNGDGAIGDRGGVKVFGVCSNSPFQCSTLTVVLQQL